MLNALGEKSVEIFHARALPVKFLLIRDSNGNRFLFPGNFRHFERDNTLARSFTMGSLRELEERGGTVIVTETRLSGQLTVTTAPIIPRPG